MKRQGIRFEKVRNESGEWVAKLYSMDGGLLKTLALIRRSRWSLPTSSVRYEVYLTFGDTEKWGYYPDTYEDTLSDAKDFILAALAGACISRPSLAKRVATTIATMEHQSLSFEGLGKHLSFSFFPLTKGIGQPILLTVKNEANNKKETNMKVSLRNKKSWNVFSGELLLGFVALEEGSWKIFVDGISQDGVFSTRRIACRKLFRNWS